MMGGYSNGNGQQGASTTYAGGMMGGYSGSSGQQGSSSTYAGGMMGNGGMMGRYRSSTGSYSGMMGGTGMMNGFEGMMSQCINFMANYGWNGTAGGSTVVIYNSSFYPQSLTVTKGTTVTWINMDFVQHTVTSGTDQAPTNLFDSHELSHMQGFSYTFNTPGTYTYFCDIHPSMVGTIVVK